MKTIDAMKQAVEILNGGTLASDVDDAAIEVLREAIAREEAQTANLLGAAKRLVEHADFRLGGILSSDSKAKEIPSNAVSQVKARHLAALRDAIAREESRTVFTAVPRDGTEPLMGAAEEEQTVEPVARVVRPEDFSTEIEIHFLNGSLPVGTELFTHPAPPPSTNPAVKQQLPTERDSLISESRQACEDGSYSLMSGLLIRCTDMLAADAQEIDSAYGEAKRLAEFIFAKHYASDEHYASGRVVWGVCDTTAGVISQIDNMMTGMQRAVVQNAEVESVLIDGIAHTVPAPVACELLSLHLQLQASDAQQVAVPQEPTHYADEHGVLYTSHRAKFLGLDKDFMMPLYAAPQPPQTNSLT